MAQDEAVFKLADDAEALLFGRLFLRSGVTAVAVLDADELVGEYEVFEALNDAFRFPVYFGWNWDALYDCVADLSWLPADRYIVVIENARRLDVLGNDSHGLLMKTLQRAARSFSSSAVDVHRKPADFSVLLYGSDDDEEMVRRFRELGIELQGLE